MMPAPAPSRPDNIEIPDRPSVASHAVNPQSGRKRVLLYGGITAAALLILIALFRPGSEEGPHVPGDAPLITAGEQPIKVSPEAPGGMEVRNRDILVYERLQGAAAAKGPLEHLLPDAEQPLTPPAPSWPAENVPSPNATLPDSLGSEASRGTSLLVPPVPEPPTRPSTEADKATQSQQSQKAKLPPSPASPGPVPAQPTMHSQPAPPSQAKVATVTATESTRIQPERPASGKGFQLQLLSSRSADDAKGAWTRLRDKNADLLGSLSPSVARVNLDDRGTFYRLRAGPIASETKARSICDSLAARRVSCLVVRSSG